jgi:hypothetical protein
MPLNGLECPLIWMKLNVRYKSTVHAFVSWNILVAPLTNSLTPLQFNNNDNSPHFYNMPGRSHTHLGLLANLIYRNYVKGYISHAKRMLVLSKRDPFPVSSVIAK